MYVYVLKIGSTMANPTGGSGWGTSGSSSLWTQFWRVSSICWVSSLTWRCQISAYHDGFGWGCFMWMGDGIVCVMYLVWSLHLNEHPLCSSTSPWTIQEQRVFHFRIGSPRTAPGEMRSAICMMVPCISPSIFGWFWCGNQGTWNDL